MALSLLIRKLSKLCRESDGQGTNYLVIPNIFVGKLIGPKGSNVREIAAKSSGTIIKIKSNKETEKMSRDCIVKVSGSLSNRQDAACIIFEQIESIRKSYRRSHGDKLSAPVERRPELAKRSSASSPDRRSEEDKREGNRKKRSEDSYREPKNRFNSSLSPRRYLDQSEPVE